MDPKEQFDKQAKHYSSSKTFSSGQGLKILTNLLKGKKFNNGLDIGTGAGFAAFELSKVCRNVEATDISEGMINERRLFQSTFELEDRKEGMLAFLEKRSPNFRNK